MLILNIKYCTFFSFIYGLKKIEYLYSARAYSLIHKIYKMNAQQQQIARQQQIALAREQLQRMPAGPARNAFDVATRPQTWKDIERSLNKIGWHGLLNGDGLNINEAWVRIPNNMGRHWN